MTQAEVVEEGPVARDVQPPIRQGGVVVFDDTVHLLPGNTSEASEESLLWGFVLSTPVGGALAYAAGRIPRRFHALASTSDEGIARW